MNQYLVDECDTLVSCDHGVLLESHHEDTDAGDSNINNRSVEWEYFLQFVKDTSDLVPYRTEWKVFDEDLKIAGAIDMVYENEDGTLDIYDWKRAKEITAANNFNEQATTSYLQHVPNTNFWHYSLQLNTYKAILEKKYNRVVRNLFLVQLHPESDKATYNIIQCADMQKEVADMFDARANAIRR
jgi:hypothetical protein